jgi:hypothetical protein
MGAVNSRCTGTKAALQYVQPVAPGQCFSVELLLGRAPRAQRRRMSPAALCEKTIDRRRTEADRYYEALTPDSFNAQQRMVLRQSMAGMLWTKQHYCYDVAEWMQQHASPPPKRDVARNGDWFHLRADDIISMPDKWEYPWFAAWDLAFHAVALSMVDIEFAKQQLDLLLDNLYVHPSGQIPAYEWSFGDVNPPVHAWATVFVYTLEKERQGTGDITFLQRSFHKLLLNFTWWVNRKDTMGYNVFQGGFLGLDNIGVFDRSAPLPTGGFLEQADGTAWMALYCQNMLQIALELAAHDDAYEDMAGKFVEHFLWIASAMHRMGPEGNGLWDEQDGFYYDVLRSSDGTAIPLKVRSIVGLLPLAASTVFEPDILRRFPSLWDRVRAFVAHHPEIAASVARADEPGVDERRRLAILDETRLRRVLHRMLDEEEFLSPYGIRSLSRHHREHPYTYTVDGVTYGVDYVPAESNSGMFGGNSNWRGPIWFPVNAILIRSLFNLALFYGDDFQVEHPTGSGAYMSLFDVAQDLCRRLTSLFLPDEHGNRPIFGGNTRFQRDSLWRDNLLFHEYFHGDNGAGLGASHQTGWTGLVAPLMVLGELPKGTPILGRVQSPRRRTSTRMIRAKVGA